MSRYIDADALDALIVESYHMTDQEYVRAGYSIVRLLIDKVPTVDAVPKEKILLLLNIAKEELSKAHANKSVNGIMTWSASVTTLEGLLREYDTADTDIVPVIRCKDCRYFRPDDDCDQCALWEYGKTDREAFCSYAMRRGEGWKK